MPLHQVFPSFFTGKSAYKLTLLICRKLAAIKKFKKISKNNYKKREKLSPLSAWRLSAEWAERLQHWPPGDLTTCVVKVTQGVIHEQLARAQLIELGDNGFDVFVVHYLRVVLSEFVGESKALTWIWTSSNCSISKQSLLSFIIASRSKPFLNFIIITVLPCRS